MDMSMSTSTSASSSMATSMSMSMVFTTDHSTPLFSSQWTPTSTGTYAGTCIFLIALAIIARFLQAWRSTMEKRWHDRAVNRRYVIVADNNEVKQSGRDAPLRSDEAILTTRGLDEKVRVVRNASRSREGVPWRLSVDLPRACVFTVQAGVAYLLMLAVMTLNVGYFLSVLAGLFVGELVIGRYALHEDSHH